MSTKTAVVTFVLVAGVGFLIYDATRSSAFRYLKVSEVCAQAGSLVGQTIRVRGRVRAGSVGYDKATATLRFEMTDGDARIAVSYKGLPPDALRDNAQVVATGVLRDPKHLAASQLQVKCPSKYEAAKNQ